MRRSLFLWSGRRAGSPSRLWAARYERLRRAYSSQGGAVDIEALEKAMRARPAQVTPDILTTTQSRLLDLALSDYLPPAQFPAPRATGTAGPPAAHLAPGNHLVHFPLALSPAGLCPDGTDPYHSPGAPFARRVWARGALVFAAPLATAGGPAHCDERILDAAAAGPPGAEKIHVTVGRAYRMGADPAAAAAACGPGLVEERRTLVLMRPLTPAQAAESLARPRRTLRPPPSYQTPCFSHTLIPTPKLLFQYSALSYNAHAIHYDPQYCREVEGYRDLLVHGPLSLTMMLRVLDSQLPRDTVIHTFEYSHMAPLYVNEPMTIHVLPSRGSRQSSSGQWEVWIEGPDGGMCVKGQCTTRPCSPAAPAPA